MENVQYCTGRLMFLCVIFKKCSVSSISLLNCRCITLLYLLDHMHCSLTPRRSSLILVLYGKRLVIIHSFLVTRARVWSDILPLRYHPRPLYQLVVILNREIPRIKLWFSLDNSPNPFAVCVLGHNILELIVIVI